MAKAIKSIETTRIDYVLGSIQDNEISSVEQLESIQNFDQQGNLIEQIDYDSSGEIAMHVRNTYQNSLIIKKEILDQSGDIQEDKTYFYKDNLLEKVVTHYAEGYEDETLYTYDANQQLLSAITYDEGEESDKIIYSRETNQLKVEVFNDFGHMESRETQVRNDKGLLIHRKLEDVEAGIREEWEYIYNEQDQPIESRYTRNPDAIRHTTKHFYEEGLEVRNETFDGKNTSVQYFQYNDQKEIVSQKEYNDKEELNHSIQRVYDENHQLLESHVEINQHGMGMDARYSILHKNAYYSE